MDTGITQRALSQKYHVLGLTNKLFSHFQQDRCKRILRYLVWLITCFYLQTDTLIANFIAVDEQQEELIEMGLENTESEPKKWKKSSKVTLTINDNQTNTLLKRSEVLEAVQQQRAQSKPVKSKFMVFAESVMVGNWRNVLKERLFDSKWKCKIW